MIVYAVNLVSGDKKGQAIETLKSILRAFHEKRFEDILSTVSESEIEKPEDFLIEFMHSFKVIMRDQAQQSLG